MLKENKTYYYILNLKDSNKPVDEQYTELFKILEDEGLKITHAVATGNEIHFLLDYIKI